MKVFFQLVRFGFIGSGVVALAIMVAGCSSCKPGSGPGRPQAYNLHMNLDESLKDSSVVVDVIPVNAYDLERWRTYSINKYWQADDAMRADADKMTFNFVSGTDLKREFKATDPKWQQWSQTGIQYLVIIADLPGVYQDGMSGSQDPRRQILPICECYWPSKTKNLVVKVQSSGVRIVTAPRPDEPLPAGW